MGGAKRPPVCSKTFQRQAQSRLLSWDHTSFSRLSVRGHVLCNSGSATRLRKNVSYKLCSRSLWMGKLSIFSQELARCTHATLEVDQRFKSGRLVCRAASFVTNGNDAVAGRRCHNLAV